MKFVPAPPPTRALEQPGDTLLWRTLHDLKAPDPGRPAFSLPTVEKIDFAEFNADSTRWITITPEDRARVIGLDGSGPPRTLADDLSMESAPWLGPTGEWLARVDRGRLSLTSVTEMPIRTKLMRGVELGDLVRIRFDQGERIVFARDPSVANQIFLWRTGLSADRAWPVALAGTSPFEIGPDGRWLAVAWAGGLRLYPLTLDALLRKARELAGRDLTEAEREQFLVAP
jgi:hypothetical protein